MKCTLIEILVDPKVIPPQHFFQGPLIAGIQYILVKMLVNPCPTLSYSSLTPFSKTSDCQVYNTFFYRTSDCWLDRMDRNEAQLKPVLEATYGEKWQRW